MCHVKHTYEALDAFGAARCRHNLVKECLIRNESLRGSTLAVPMSRNTPDGSRTLAKK
jgi:hypothetical protein